MSSRFYSSGEYDINKYAQALYNCRMNMNLNMKEFAKFIGVNITTYQRNERALIDKIPVTIIDALHNKLGYPPEKFLFPVNPNCISTQMKTWLKTDEAIPYILNAYSQYKIDRLHTLNKRAQEIKEENLKQ